MQGSQDNDGDLEMEDFEHEDPVTPTQGKAARPPETRLQADHGGLLLRSLEVAHKHIAHLDEVVEEQAEHIRRLSSNLTSRRTPRATVPAPLGKGMTGVESELSALVCNTHCSLIWLLMSG
jgi:ATP-dependent Clp protease ATP-binding subunit ClpA